MVIMFSWFGGSEVPEVGEEDSSSISITLPFSRWSRPVWNALSPALHPFQASQARYFGLQIFDVRPHRDIGASSGQVVRWSLFLLFPHIRVILASTSLGPPICRRSRS
jgi:hypothetical protein